MIHSIPASTRPEHQKPEYSAARFSQVAAFQCVQPFFGTVLAFAVLGEEPSMWDLGAVGVIGGLALVSLDKSQAGAAGGGQPSLPMRLWRRVSGGPPVRSPGSPSAKR